MSTPEDHFAALFWLECSLAAAHAAFCRYCFFPDGARRASFDALGVLLLVSIVVLVTHAARLSLAPFNPANISGGLAGLGLGFPIAVYMFVGWENSAALAEETSEPRRNVPRAVYASILLMSLSYLLFMYSTVVAFNYI